MNDIVPSPGSGRTPARGPLPATGKPGRSFRHLRGSIVGLTLQALRLKEGMRRLQSHMSSNASKASNLAEMSGQADVDQVFVTQIMGVSQALRDVATASGDLADSADAMEAASRGFNDAHEREYRGVYEAVQASPYRQPKPGFNRVR
ncbi:conjugal transfer protein TraB [Kitasatospora sp. NPDC004272]